MPENQELPSRYDVKEVEDRIYALWEDSGYFNPDICVEKNATSSEAEPFSIVLPPPNVTGTLHIGHAFEDTLQDAMIRFERMRGKRTLWVPGTDHAAIATQAKVEKILWDTEHKSRHDLGREEFLRRVEQFAKESQSTIIRQVKRLGTSMDWSRECYTFDEKRNQAVREAFKRLYDLGLIYRGARIVNWDPKLQTTISDDEIEWREETVPLYYLRYGPFQIATARPETKFGDKYVVMHPEDKRYEQYKHGEKFELEWINGPVVATVIKDPVVDMAFGTGVMTITPWHDAVDFDLSERYKLEKEQIIDLQGRLLPIAGEFAGMKIAEARPKIVEKLKTKGLLPKIEEKYVHRIAVNSRGGGVVEPQILEQWFVNVNKKFRLEHSELDGIASGQETTLKEILRQTVASDQIKMMPERFRKTYFHWIDNLRDWCISRQLWFGHRIPVWYCKARSEERGARSDNPIVSIEDVSSCPSCGGPVEQDPDTLDTWFSSGLWTFTTLGWPFLSQLSGPDSKTWDLKIYGEDIFRALVNGTKRIETRAGKAESSDKYWGDFKPGDVIDFRLADEATDTILSPERKVSKVVKNVQHFPTLKEMFAAYSATHDYPGKTTEQIEDWWRKRPALHDRIQKYGIWVFELADPDLAAYHPTSLMAPGYELIFFWVARMILFAGSLLGQVPFRTVCFHGIVRDKQGKKFSKSAGNGIDPLELSDKYGADALRMSLIVGAAPGNDVKFDESKVRGYRNFTTKIWNASRFVLMNKPTRTDADKERGLTQMTDDWQPRSEARQARLKELADIRQEITAHMEKYELHLASEKAYHYFWHTFADKIIEENKAALRGDDMAEKIEAYYTLETILRGALKLLHPFVPFITEEVWQILARNHAEYTRNDADGRRPMLMAEKW
ncbi:MAG: class I tRNA ligase family protein [Candidatus Liptonbacteria bacterium]|nr:class I tRNA ligase family protein [Candidatus Liptonbacteria bacterium]